MTSDFVIYNKFVIDFTQKAEGKRKGAYIVACKDDWCIRRQQYLGIIDGEPTTTN